jgi:two-component system chemotaxis response regulator CheB
VKRCGGIAVVQSPDDAFTPDMPASALRHVNVDHVASANEIPALLARLVHETPGPPPPEVPFDIRLETAIAAQEVVDMAADDALGMPSRYTCPECHGTLWEVTDGTMMRYRCHTGHAFTADAMVAAQSDQIENTLYNLLRVHSERADLVRRLADQAGTTSTGATLRGRAAAYQEDAELVRKLIRARTAADIEAPEH